MSTESRIIGFGPYKKELKNFFHYPEHWYNDVQEGENVIIHICNTVTRSQSKDLFESLFNEPMRFEKQEIRIENINREKLKQFLFENYGDDCESIYWKIFLFLKAGFRLFFDFNS